MFLVYSFLGWCLEVFFYAINKGKFINRGFLNGPFCPIYGFSLIFIHLFLFEKVANPIWIFFISGFIVSMMEVIVGFLLHKVFNQRWWDYSNEKYNIGGYICLRFSLTWGLLCLVIINYIHPLIVKLTSMIPNNIGLIIVISLYIIITIDFISTLKSIIKFNNELKIITNISDKIFYLSNKIGNKIADSTIKTNARIEPISKELIKLSKEKEIRIKELFNKQKKLFFNFPNYMHYKYSNVIKELKKYYNREKK